MSEDQSTESSKLLKEKVFKESPESQYINSWKEILDAPIDLWLLCLIKLFSYISIYTFVSSFSIYITDVRDQSDTYLAQIYAIMGTFAIFSMIFLGNLADRYGVRLILISGSFLLLLKYTLLLMIQNLWTQRIFFLIPGIIATTLINPTIETGIKHFTGQNYRTLAFSLYFSVTALAALISGIAISLFLIVGDKNQETFDILFIFCAGISCVSLGLSFLSRNFDTEKLPENAIDLEAQKKVSGWEHTRELIILKKFWRLFSVVSIITIIRSVFFQQLMTLSLYMERDLGDDSWYGSMLVLNQTIIIATTPLLSYSVYYFRPYQIFIISGCIAIIAPLFFIIGASYFTICVYSVNLCFEGVKPFSLYPVMWFWALLEKVYWLLDCLNTLCMYLLKEKKGLLFRSQICLWFLMLWFLALLGLFYWMSFVQIMVKGNVGKCGSLLQPLQSLPL